MAQTKRYRVKRGDLPSFIRGTCRQVPDDAPNANPVPVLIQTADEVRLLASKRAGTPHLLSIVAVNLDDGTEANRGRWEHAWTAEDLAEPGTYNLEVQVTWPGGERLTFPTNGYNELIIEPDLGG